MPPTERRPARYRLYVDESGDHTYKRIEEAPSRYLALVGVWFQQPQPYSDFADALERFKRNVFGPRPDEPVILHRSDIVRRRGVFGHLVDAARRRRFDDGLLGVVRTAQFRMVCVVIDKKQHLERYTSPFHPYHYCMAALLERYTGWLDMKHALGDVMAESRGREENRQLQEAYRRVYESGTFFHDREQMQRTLTSNKLKLKNKDANIAGLQLADLLAHPVKQHCLAHRKWIDDTGGSFADAIVEAVMRKFNRQEYQNRLDGYGRVYL